MRRRSFADERLDSLSPDTQAIYQQIFPNIDLNGAGAFLQLAFVTFGIILVGFAAATLVNGWASDETGGRLETLLSTPMSRASAGRSRAASACSPRSA